MSTAEAGPRTYGNWRLPKSAGLFGLGTLGTLGLFIGLILMIVAMMIGNLLYGLGVFVMVVAAVFAVTRRDKHGRNIIDRVSAITGYWRGKSAKRTSYRSGPAGRIPSRRFQLPGLAGRSRLTQHTDGLGRKFAVIYHPSPMTYTVTLETDPDGGSLVDQSQVDQWVAQWGNWLATLGDEPGMVAASVTVETAPDTGHRLSTEIESNIDPTSPALAQEMLRQTMRQYPSGSAFLKAYIGLTFKAAPRVGARIRKPEEFALDIATRLPGLTQRLAAAGAGGAARPMDKQRLCEVVRTAYDPAAAPLFADARAEGHPVEMDWEDVGPTAHEANWTEFVHDSGASVSWVMSIPPRGVVQSTILDRLMGPAGRVDRKRVTLLYHPIDAADAGNQVESDLRDADFAVNSANKPSQRELHAQNAARSTAQEEASGAGLVNFGMIVTATVINAAELAEAEAVVENLTAAARLTVRRAYGMQDTAFAAGLPIGIDVSRHIGGTAALAAQL